MNEEQQRHDIWREKSFNSQIAKSCIGSSIHFVRVKAYDVSLEELNHRIDEVVSLLNKKIADRTSPLFWQSHAEFIEDIKKRGTIEVDHFNFNCFESNAEIINLVYGKTTKAGEWAL